MQNESHEDHSPHLLKGWRFGALITTIILTVVGYLLFALWGGWKEVWEACLKVGFLGISLALCLSLVNYGLRYLRWDHFLKVLGYKIPWFDNLRIYIAGFALTTTPGKAGEALRSLFLKDFHVPYRQSFGAFIAERLSDLIAILVLTIFGLLAYPQAKFIVLPIAALILLLLYAVQQDRWLKKLENFARGLLSERTGHLVEFFIETILAFRSCFHTKVLLYGIFLGIIAWGAEGAAFYIILKLLGANIDFATAVFIYAFSMLIGAITFLPGGLGGMEVTMLQLLLFNNVDPSSAVAATLVIRLATLWFSVILGLIALPKTHTAIT